MVRIPTSRTPTHPGEILLKEFLVPMKITEQELADSMHLPYQWIDDLVNGKRGITPSMALRLSKLFATSPDFWMNLQQRWDIDFSERYGKEVI